MLYVKPSALLIPDLRVANRFAIRKISSPLSMIPCASRGVSVVRVVIRHLSTTFLAGILLFVMGNRGTRGEYESLMRGSVHTLLNGFGPAEKRRKFASRGRTRKSAVWLLKRSARGKGGAVAR